MTNPIFYLEQVDPKLQRPLQTIQLQPLKGETSPFVALLSSVLSQQLSTKAAQTISNRFFGLFDTSPCAEQLMGFTTEKLRTVGVSRQKSSYLHAIAQHRMDNDAFWRNIHDFDDQQIATQLIQIKGVGQWTIDMLLLFCLQRPDIWPVGDLAIQDAMKRLYGLDLKGKALQRSMKQLAESWRPYRSTVSRLLWKWRDQNYP